MLRDKRILLFNHKSNLHPPWLKWTPLIHHGERKGKIQHWTTRKILRWGLHAMVPQDPYWKETIWNRKQNNPQTKMKILRKLWDLTNTKLISPLTARWCLCFRCASHDATKLSKIPIVCKMGSVAVRLTISKMAEANTGFFSFILWVINWVMNLISAKDIYTNVWAMKTCGGVRDARSLALKSSCAA